MGNDKPYCRAYVLGIATCAREKILVDESFVQKSGAWFLKSSCNRRHRVNRFYPPERRAGGGSASALLPVVASTVRTGVWESTIDRCKEVREEVTDEVRRLYLRAVTDRAKVRVGTKGKGAGGSFGGG